MVFVVLKASRVAIESLLRVPKEDVTSCSYSSRTCNADLAQHTANPARRGFDAWPVWRSSLTTKLLRSDG